MDARERVRLLGGDGDIDVEPPRRLEKVGRPIRRRRQEKEDPRHGAILSPARRAAERRPVTQLSRQPGWHAARRHLKKKEVAMNVIPPQPKPKRLPLLASLLAALVLLPGLPATARAEVDCLETYVNCVQAAADLGTVSERSWAGLRCAYQLIACLQRRLA